MGSPYAGAICWCVIRQRLLFGSPRLGYVVLMLWDYWLLFVSLTLDLCVIHLSGNYVIDALQVS